ncbi:MAG: DUF5667 domain-containing protein [Patescibacteria group bacterium]
MKPKSNFLMVVLAAMLSLVVSVNVIQAQSEASDSKSKIFLEEKAAVIEPGVLPDSFWYWADIFSEEVQFLFTVGKESKGDFLLGVAEERLAEMKKLSEEGINNYADDLTSKHEVAITKAQELLAKAKTKGLEEIKEGQIDLEKKILLQENEMKKQAKGAPKKYDEITNQAFNRVSGLFKTALSHLSWKKTEIKKQKAELFE